MSSVWRVVLVVVLLLPIGGYVVGSLLAHRSGDPAPRPPMRIGPPLPGPQSDPGRTGEPEAHVDDDRDDDLVPVSPQPGTEGAGADAGGDNDRSGDSSGDSNDTGSDDDSEAGGGGDDEDDDRGGG